MEDATAKSAAEKQTYVVEKTQTEPQDTPNPKTATKQYTWKGADGKVINYEGIAEMLDIFADDGKPICHMFELSYISDAKDKSDRPVTFLWNGVRAARRAWSALAVRDRTECRRTASNI